MQEEIWNSPWGCWHCVWNNSEHFREPWVRVWGKIQELSYCQGHSAPHPADLGVWGRDHSTPTLIQSQNENPRVFKVGKLLQDHQVQPRTHHLLISQSRALKPICSHGELTAPLTVLFHFLEYRINLLLELFLEGKSNDEQKGFMP